MAPVIEMEPRGQAAHSEDVGSRSRPAGQSTQYGDPSSEVPLVHVSHAVIPDDAENSPAEQGSHVASLTAPGVVLLVPGGQGLHADASPAPVAAL